MFRFPRKTAQPLSMSEHERFLEFEGIIAPVERPSTHQPTIQPKEPHSRKLRSFADQRYDPKPLTNFLPTHKAPNAHLHRTHSNLSSADTFTEFITTPTRKHEPSSHLIHDAAEPMSVNPNWLTRLVRKASRSAPKDIPSTTFSTPPHKQEKQCHDNQVTDPLHPISGETEMGSHHHTPFRFNHDAIASSSPATNKAGQKHPSTSLYNPLSPSLDRSTEVEARTAPVKIKHLHGTVEDLNRPHQFHFDYSTGAAARAAAALQNAAALQKELEEQLRCLTIPEIDVTQDSGSGIGAEFVDIVREQSLVRHDPIQRLPAEVMIEILVHLDPRSLMNAEQLSQRWLKTARDDRIWKRVFEVELADAYDNNFDSNLIGLGPSGKFRHEHWKEMLLARLVLDKRWKEGRATAIYLEGHTDSVYCVQFDREIIVTGSRDRTIRVWSTQSHQCLRILGIPTTSNREIQPLPPHPSALSQRPLATIFPSASFKKNPPTVAFDQTRHTGSVLCLQYDRQILVTGSSDATLIIWKWKPAFDCSPIRQLYGHHAGVLDVCFNDLAIVSSSKDTTLCHWDRASGKLIQKLRGHLAPVNAVKIRGDLAVSASGDGTARLWDLSRGVCVRIFSSDKRGLACVEFSLDMAKIFAGGNNQVIYQFNARTGKRMKLIRGHRELVRSLHLDNSNRRIVSGSYDRSVQAFDLRTGKNIVQFRNWTSSWILCAKADYRRIVASSQDSRVVIMDFGYGIPAIDLLEGFGYEPKA